MKTGFTSMVVGVLMAVSLVGCGGEDSASKGPDAAGSSSPAVAVTPGVQADGRYQLGTLADPEAAAALKAAVETLPLAVSYDYRSLADSLARATEAMTPAFAEDFREVFEATTREKAVDEEAITTALVRGAGVVDTVVNDRITCLIYLDQVLVASKLKKPNSPLKVKQNSVHVRMQKIDGSWKVDGIEPF